MLNELRTIQRRCDEISFTLHGKPYSELTESEILNHKCFHLANLLAKISRVCEQRDHDIDVSTDHVINEVIPDLIIYSLQIANLYNVDLDSKYKERLEYVLEKGKTLLSIDHDHIREALALLDTSGISSTS